MEFIFYTNKPELAEYAQSSGIERVMIDLEYMGKKERQGHLDTMINDHTLEDVSKVRCVLNKTKLQVRVNPIHTGSEQEITEAISRGADIIMLPMFTTCLEVEKFISIVNSKAKTSLLLETAQAMVRVDEILKTNGIDEIHIGINDLHLSMNLDFMFELFSGGIVEYLVKKINKAAIPVGVGGISRLGTGAIDPSLILSEHVRLGSNIVILSRGFHNGITSLQELRDTFDLPGEIKKAKVLINDLSMASAGELLSNKKQLSNAVLRIVNKNA